MRKVFIINGLPGSGKGTQAVKIADELNLVHISSGQLIRDAINENTEQDFIAEIRKRVEKGIPQPDDVVNKLVENKISSLSLDSGIIFDSYPITIPQAEYLLKISNNYKLEAPIFIYLKVDPESVIKRLSTRKICDRCGLPVVAGDNEEKCKKCGGNLITRSDDTEEVVHNRINNYTPLLKDMVEFYRLNGKIIEINGDQTVPEVSKDIKTALND